METDGPTLWERTRDALFGADIPTSPVYLLICLGIAWGLWRWRRVEGGFWAFALPRPIWSHASTRVDLWLFVIGRVMAVTGLIARFGVVPLVAIWVAGAMPVAPFAGDGLGPVWIGLIFWLTGDFATYWVHRWHHQWATLWPLHAVHHSAEVLTPFTVFRQHPVGQIVNMAMQSAVMGVVLGVLVGALSPDLTVAQIAGVNAFTVAAILAMANFHHAHIWISYGPVLERLLISPAQHQIHHSTDPAHFNRNFGASLAIWDWMFGTLYLTGEREDLRFGLDGRDEAPLMTQRLDQVLIDPLRRMVRFGR